MTEFSWSRLWAIISKEFIQMKRDVATFAMIIGIPIIQIILFGYAINTDPKHLPTAILTADESPFIRTFISGMQNTDYFSITKIVHDEKQAVRMLNTGEVQFIVSFPPLFSKELVRGETPELLVEADATDPVATGNALGAIQILSDQLFSQFNGSLNYLTSSSLSVAPIVHAKFNPADITQYNIVPALIGVVLTMTMVMITAVAVTREKERGTLENLLATPVQPTEVMIGKVIPYVIVGYIQLTLIIIFAKVLFAVPIMGSLLLLFIVALPFIAANLSVGLMFSTVASNQLQAIQMSTFFFLPSILLSGFLFPFRGMPEWAQWIGSVLPLTHFLRVVRGVLLKGNTFTLIWPELWPILLFMIVALWIGVKRYHQTLD
jgi:ABC-2 type transport system permease protein